MEIKMAKCWHEYCENEATKSYNDRDWCDDCLLESIYKCWNCNKPCDPFNHYVSDDFHFCSKECTFNLYLNGD